MQLFKEVPNIKFINKRYYAFGLSGLIILVGVVLFFTRGFNMGIDFSGGTMIEVSFQNKTSIPQVRGMLDRINLGDAQITRIGGENKFFIKTLASLKKLNIASAVKMEDVEEYELVARQIKNSMLDDGGEGQGRGRQDRPEQHRRGRDRPLPARQGHGG